MENEGGMLEARVVNQPLPSEEEMEKASRRRTLAVLDPKETVHTESYEGPTRVTLEKVMEKKQLKTAEEKKKKKKKEKKVEGNEEAQPRKEKKEIKLSEKREHGQEENRLKKKEKRKRLKAHRLTENPPPQGWMSGCQRNEENQRNLKRHQHK